MLHALLRMCPTLHSTARLAPRWSQHGPMSVSINAGPLNGYHGGVINCTGSGIDHAVALVAYGTDAATGEAYWTSE